MNNQDHRHDCLSGAGCSSSTMEDGVKTPATTAGPDELCEGCIHVLERVLDELPEMWLSLELALGDKSGGNDQRVSGTRSAPIPIAVEVAATQDAIVEWVAAGASRVAEVMNTADTSPASRTTAEHGRSVVDGCRLLRHNLSRLLAGEAEPTMVWLTSTESARPGESWTDSQGKRRGVKLMDMSGIDVALEIKRRHKKARNILGQTQAQDDRPLACPLCENANAYRSVKTVRGKVYDNVSCTACGSSGDYDWYQTMVGVKLHHMEEDKMDKEEREELERLRSEVASLREYQERVVAAEAKAARLERGFLAAADPLFSEMTAREFADAVLKEAS